MRVLIATPAFGGLLTSQYVTSLLGTLQLLRAKQIEYEVYFLANESLIPRARNKCAKYAIAHQFTDLLFIDADMIWDPAWVGILLSSNHDIIGGTYPIKTLPLKLNFNALPTQAEDWGKDRSVAAYVQFVKKYADLENGIVEVMHIPTGFMRIKIRALEHLIETERVKTYESFEPATGEVETYWDFFPAGERDGKYESEDWGFCRLMRSFLPIYLQTQIVCGHTGTFNFGLDRSQ